MSRRINVMIDDDAWGLIEKIPSGERSRTVNEALRIWAQQRRRRDAAAEMDALRAQLPKVSTTEVVRWIREDREQGHQTANMSREQELEFWRQKTEQLRARQIQRRQMDRLASNT